MHAKCHVLWWLLRNRHAKCYVLCGMWNVTFGMWCWETYNVHVNHYVYDVMLRDIHINHYIYDVMLRDIHVQCYVYDVILRDIHVKCYGYDVMLRYIHVNCYIYDVILRDIHVKCYVYDVMLRDIHVKCYIYDVILRDIHVKCYIYDVMLRDIHVKCYVYDVMLRDIHDKCYFKWDVQCATPCFLWSHAQACMQRAFWGNAKVYILDVICSATHCMLYTMMCSKLTCIVCRLNIMCEDGTLRSTYRLDFMYRYVISKLRNIHENVMCYQDWG